MTKRETLLPSPEEELLLQAALGDRPTALPAWEAWCSAFDYDDLNSGTRRLFPLLHANLSAFGIVDRRLAPKDDSQRLGWYRSQQLMQRLRRVLSSFSDAGIETILLKGLPLAFAYYDHPDHRPIGDLDVMVRHRDWRRAVDILIATGWHTDDPEIDPLQRSAHAIVFIDRQGFEFDLHSSPFQECVELPKLEGFWNAAIPLVRPGIVSLSLCASDQLLHCLTHGLRRNEVSSVRWVADAVMILRREPELDWQRLLEQSAILRLRRPVSTGLAYVAALFPNLVPAKILGAFAGHTVGWLEHVEWHARKHERLTGPGSRLGAFFRLHGQRPLRDQLAALPSYLADTFGTRSRVETAIALGRKSLKALRKRS
ncbi:MAG TPA: nucleotidyltransferase family protein [Aliidongia sp.]|uniref:nucleotidyltransferase family protein n=1 Tax=Aliidongia sp. TaxID=1914230 RepID=UPI002DDD9314|nr:nucleotidyltransferase family protein [Aliidongia sp.]HEV2674601.1 nucleotidyltransferase family protein [Aliidongia sp.]